MKKAQNTDLKAAYGLAQKGDHDTALAICNAYIAANPNGQEGFRERASVLLHKGDVKSALADLQHVVASGSNEPSDHFDLGRTLLAQGAFIESASALSRALDLSSRHDGYYVNASRLLRALAYAELARKDDARRDLQQLPDDASFHVSGRGLVSKAELQKRVR